MKEIRYAREARRALMRMPRNVAERIRAKLDQYAERPAELATQVKRIKGEARLRLRIGNWRAIFEEGETEIHVLFIRPRGSAYD